jgi:preprotein translocase subunit SecG
MKKILTQYLWIFVTIFLLLNLTIFILPKEENRLDKLDEMIKKVEQKEIILTPTEKLLEQKATEKDWEEVDKETNK